MDELELLTHWPLPYGCPEMVTLLEVIRACTVVEGYWKEGGGEGGELSFIAWMVPSCR